MATLFMEPLEAAGDEVGEGLGEGAEEDVDDALGGLDVAGGDGGGLGGVDDGGFGESESEGPKAAFIGGNGFVQEAAEDVVDGGAGDGGDGVDGRGTLGGGAGEVAVDGVTADGDGETDGDRIVAAAVVVEGVFEGVGAVGDGVGGGAGHALGVVQEVRHLVPGVAEAVAVDDLLEAYFANAVGGYLGVEVAAALVRGTDVAEDEVEERLVEAAALVELDGWDDDALLEELAHQGHGAWGAAADIGVVGA